jgi:hypothetical protein
LGCLILLFISIDKATPFFVAAPKDNLVIQDIGTAAGWLNNSHMAIADIALQG